MAGHAADFLPVADIVMNNKKTAQHDGLRYTIVWSKHLGLTVILLQYE